MTAAKSTQDRQLFGALLDAAVDAMIVIDERGTVRQINRSGLEMFGYPAASVIGQNVSQLMPESYSRRHDSYLENYRESGHKKIIGIGREVEGKRADGTIFPMDLSVGEGRVDGERFFIGIVRDLTDRYALVHQLRERESEVRGLVENALVATGAIDQQGRFLSWNDAFEKVFHTSDLRGHAVINFLEPPYRDTFTAAIAGLLSGGGSVLLNKQRFKAKDQQTCTGDVFLSAIVDVDAVDAPIHRLVIQFVDRTSEIEAERAALEAQNHLAHLNRVGTLGEMAAGIAHEVNQPLGAISNYAQAARMMLASPNTDPERLSEILDKVATQAQRAGEVIRRMRSLAGQQDTDREVCSVGPLIEEVVRLFETDARFEISTLDLAVEPELPDISADRVQIQQVVLNLLRNALDAMSDLPTSERILKIDCDAVDEGIEIRVTDSGHGIGGDFADQIMNPFVSTKGNGMGMGLTICHSIVTSHGGKIWHTANSPDPGTTFHVLLPHPQRLSNA